MVHCYFCFMLRSLFPTNDNNNSTVINTKLQLPQNDLRPACVSDKNADFVGFVALIKAIITFLNV